MKFKAATDILFSETSHADLAKALGVSVATVRQARLGADAMAHRSPPEGWEKQVVRLANERAVRLTWLSERLRRGF